MCAVLQEWQLWKEGMVGFCNSSSPTCMCHVLEQQPAFTNQHCLLQEVIEQHGHKIIFYPKFQCKLNFIEMYWSAIKRYARTNCDYTWRDLQRIVPEALDSVSLKQIRKYARKSFDYHYMDAYQKGMNVKQAEYAVRKYKRHCVIPHSILNEL
jgi:hypothetical protein